jgi:hypothetical protein
VIPTGRDSYFTHGTRAETLLSKLEPRNPIGPRRIPAELPCSSYDEGSRHTRRLSGPQSLATLPTRLCLDTILRMGDLQVEFLECGMCVCVDFHREEPFIEAEESLYRLNQVSLEEMDGRAAIHVDGRPLLPGSTDFQRWIPLVN